MTPRYSKQARKFLAKQSAETEARIKTLVDVMPTIEAERLFSYIASNFHLTSSVDLWDMVAEEEPDEIDIEMMREMENNPDCNDIS